MTTVLPEAEGAVLAGQMPVTLGTRSFDVNGAEDASTARPEACAAGARKEAAPGPVQDPTSSSGTVLAASHWRRRRPVRGADNAAHL